MCKEKLEQIKCLNDLLRQRHIGGLVMITTGVQQLDPDELQALLEAIADFAAFSDHNDPWGEHDCAVMEVNGERYIWKIDCYDKSLSLQSPDPSDSLVTERILTVMRSDEY